MSWGRKDTDQAETVIKLSQIYRTCNNVLASDNRRELSEATTVREISLIYKYRQDCEDCIRGWTWVLQLSAARKEKSIKCTRTIREYISNACNTEEHTETDVLELWYWTHTCAKGVGKCWVQVQVSTEYGCRLSLFYLQVTCCEH